ncbi:hypothetical protein H4N54_23365 [Limnospira fusiformis KN01]|uniref:hypothetical protein n=1 Tax=Limnospira fusiformis TaxID=54297 RepID=UPI000DC283DB|nr:hypothetical protein [Limnospira fusiformis]MDY7052363.1 hypothetical protein [Limnospira fusiformis LS22]RAQ48666.1 hypothetical protein B9S53_02050 [Arthrospira sp. O9.13F]ULB45301.1 hypothetical protein H4N54_23365 [Limnospira fusiformis KN01]
MTEPALTPINYLPINPIFPLFIFMTLMGFIYSCIVAIKDGLKNVKKLHNIPCSRCAFFTGDYRLKCTVHPCKALSEEAINCRDFELNTGPARNRPPLEK